MTKAPALFVGHGGPHLTMTENPITKGWADIATRFEKPRAIVCVSAHWVTDGVALTANETQRTIHDFTGFPPELYEVRYEPPGAPALAADLTRSLAPFGARTDASWGLDHGAWSVLRWMYPDADVPVIQLSLDTGRAADAHYAIGQTLAPLRDDGVLVMGSGNIVHNLAVFFERMDGGDMQWAREFEDHIVQSATAGNDRAVIDYKAHPAAPMAAPDWDHFFPLLYALGARDPSNEQPQLFNRVVGRGLAMTALGFGLAA